LETSPTNLGSGDNKETFYKPTITYCLFKMVTFLKPKASVVQLG
jgi:hypothetical protein